jgi:hypothetical protein
MDWKESWMGGSKARRWREVWGGRAGRGESKAIWKVRRGWRAEDSETLRGGGMTMVGMGLGHLGRGGWADSKVEWH